MNKISHAILLFVCAFVAVHAQRSPLLSNVPVDALRNGVFTNGILNGLSVPGLGKRNENSFNGLFGGILGGKGVAVSAVYSTNVFVHADIAATIAVDIPTQGGLLAPITGLLGGVASIGNVLGKVDASTTVLNIKAKADVQVSIGVLADVEIALPAGCSSLFSEESIFGNVQLGLKIDLSADVPASATLITPVLNTTPATSGAISLIKLNPQDNSFVTVPTHFDANSGRVVADLGAQAIVGTYFFVHIQANI